MVLAVIINNTLHVANVGDSRALIVREIPGGGGLDIEQLSTDHGVDNVNELDRLEVIGLNRDQLKKSGRLGSQENTRSIGDYCLKGGYKDVDALRFATLANYGLVKINFCHVVHHLVGISLLLVGTNFSDDIIIAKNSINTDLLLLNQQCSISFYTCQ